MRSVVAAAGSSPLYFQSTRSNSANTVFVVVVIIWQVSLVSGAIGVEAQVTRAKQDK